MTSESTTTLHTVTVFLGGDDDAPTGGNPLGVFVDAPGLSVPVRQRIAADLGFSETVFVEDTGTGRLHIHTPAVELPLAGHPLVGTSWLLGHLGTPPAALIPPAGTVPTWSDGMLTWIRADPSAAPPFDTRELGSPEEVDAVAAADAEPGVNLHVWAWEDEARGRVRVRVFPDDMGIGEDEATGAAALRLCALLGRPLTIRQGAGSRIEARPAPDGTVDVGGRSALLETSAYRLPSQA